MVYTSAVVEKHKIVLTDANGNTKVYQVEEAAFIMAGLPKNYTADHVLREVYGYENMVESMLVRS